MKEEFVKRTRIKLESMKSVLKQNYFSELCEYLNLHYYIVDYLESLNLGLKYSTLEIEDITFFDFTCFDEEGNDEPNNLWFDYPNQNSTDSNQEIIDGLPQEVAERIKYCIIAQLNSYKIIKKLYIGLFKNPHFTKEQLIPIVFPNSSNNYEDITSSLQVVSDAIKNTKSFNNNLYSRFIPNAIKKNKLPNIQEYLTDVEINLNEYIISGHSEMIGLLKEIVSVFKRSEFLNDANKSERVEKQLKSIKADLDYLITNWDEENDLPF